MTKEPKVSIIIPTYNRCEVWNLSNLKSDENGLLKNIVNQTYENIEVIIVNDGSNDSTQEYLADLSTISGKFRIINKRNEGVSSTRNTGIEAVTGEYVFFIDDDDDVPSDYIESFMHPRFGDAELIIDSYKNQIDRQKPVSVHFPSKALNLREDLLEYIFYLSEIAYPFFGVGKRFKADLIKKNRLKFRTDTTLGEDRIFVLDYIGAMQENTCHVIDESGYIVKSVSNVNARLSQGQKPIDYLLKNFAFTYDYLENLYKECFLERIKIYKDNYLIDKMHDYVLLPLSYTNQKGDIDKVKDKGRELLKKIDKKHIKSQYKRLILQLCNAGLLPVAFNVIKARVILSQLKQKIKSIKLKI